MKSYLTLVMAFLCLSASAQIEKYKLPLTADSSIVYEAVVPIDSAVKAPALYSAAKTWFANNFASGKAVLQSEDKETGRILGKFTIHPYQAWNATVVGEVCDVNVQIDVKDGKYRYRFYGFSGHGIAVAGNGYNIDVSRSYREYLNEKYRIGGLVNKKSMYAKCYKSFKSIDNEIQALVYALNSTLKNSKSDTF